jgi:flagellar FliL protein
MSILIPVLLSSLLTLGAMAGGVYWLMQSGRLGSTPANATQVTSKPAALVASHVTALEPMIVNLADGRSYLRVSVSLRMRDDVKAEKSEEGSKPEKGADGVVTALRDTTLSVLSSSTADSLLAPEGRAALKKTLEAAYKEHNEESHVLDVYFTEFLVQRG